VRFSGPHGLVARQVGKPGVSPDAHWSLPDTHWLSLLPAPAQLDARFAPRWLVFEQTEDDALRLSRVLRINGVLAHGQTELLFTLSPLSVVKSLPAIIVTAPADGRVWSEELALDGSPDRPNAPWSWCERALHVGAAVLGGH
jgi:hypothetical protein